MRGGRRQSLDPGIRSTHRRPGSCAYTHEKQQEVCQLKVQGKRAPGRSSDIQLCGYRSKLQAVVATPMKLAASVWGGRRLRQIRFIGPGKAFRLLGGKTGRKKLLSGGAAACKDFTQRPIKARTRGVSSIWESVSPRLTLFTISCMTLPEPPSRAKTSGILLSDISGLPCHV
jgi:hypothetical protein